MGALEGGTATQLRNEAGLSTPSCQEHCSPWNQKEMFQDPPRGYETICQQSPTDTKIALESNEDLEPSEGK